MSSDYQFKYMDYDHKAFEKKQGSGLPKFLLKLGLVAFIVFQGYTYVNKKQAQQAAQSPHHIQQASGFSAPAYASDNGGMPLDIPYNPYAGATSNNGQMNAAANAEAQKILQSGDIAKIQEEMARHGLLQDTPF